MPLPAGLTPFHARPPHTLTLVCSAAAGARHSWVVSSAGVVLCHRLFALRSSVLLALPLQVDCKPYPTIEPKAAIWVAASHLAICPVGPANTMPGRGAYFEKTGPRPVFSKHYTRNAEHTDPTADLADPDQVIGRLQACLVAQV